MLDFEVTDGLGCVIEGEDFVHDGCDRPQLDKCCKGVGPAADMHDEWQVTDRRYLSEASMALLHKTSHNETTAAITSGA